jgi:SWI/SNF-related matrix-associated actin-dependent regulator 1 of chromatin subfamily A
VQTICFLAWLKYKRQQSVDSHSDEQLPHLIIVPVSTLQNWMREFEKFCPHMNVVKYHGTMDEREDTKNRIRQELNKNVLDVIVAPVTYFSKETSPDRKFLNSMTYDYL